MDQIKKSTSQLKLQSFDRQHSKMNIEEARRRSAESRASQTHVTERSVTLQVYLQMLSFDHIYAIYQGQNADKLKMS